MRLELKRGQTIEEDVAGPKEIVLVMYVRRPGTQEMPAVKVTEVYGGFATVLRNMTLESTDEDPDGWPVDLYTIAVDWSGLGDKGGAWIEAIFPDTKELAKAHIFMDY